MDEIIPIFPTPIMRVAGLLPPPLVAGLVAHFGAQAVQDNSSSPMLSHTRMLKPSDSPLLVEVAARITP